MKVRFVFAAVCLLLPALNLHADSSEEVKELKAEVRRMQADFEKAQKEYQEQIDRLTRRIDQLSGPSPASNPIEKPDERKNLEAQLAKELAGNSPTNSNGRSTSAEVKEAPFLSISPREGAVFRAGSAYMNMGFDAMMDAGFSTAKNPGDSLQLGDHDPLKRGFSLRNAEISLDGAVDPYFKAFANIVLKLDRDNETEIELEEVFAETTSLPLNLQLRAGQFFAAFGRQNAQHPHTWAFVDSPIILTRAFGPEGLRSIGTQLSWLAPTPFYSELFLGVFDGAGGTAFNFRNPGEPTSAGNQLRGHGTITRELRGPGDLVYVPRAVTSFEITDTQTLLFGLSGAFGPNDTGPHSRTEIYGGDVFWKWKSPNAHKGFPFVSWQTEVLRGRYGLDADPSGSVPAENQTDVGFYTQLLWGFHPGWVGGLRGEQVWSNDSPVVSPFRGDRTRISPVLSWYPTEFSKIRLQYNYDWGEQFSDEHSVWLQFEFQLGAHAAHKF
jgi:hypothetical protein